MGHPVYVHVVHFESYKHRTNREYTGQLEWAAAGYKSVFTCSSMFARFETFRNLVEGPKEIIKHQLHRFFSVLTQHLWILCEFSTSVSHTLTGNPNNCSNLLVNLLDPISTPGPSWTPRQRWLAEEKNFLVAVSRLLSPTVSPVHGGRGRRDLTVTWPLNFNATMRNPSDGRRCTRLDICIDRWLAGIKTVGHPREYRCRASFKVLFFSVHHDDKCIREFEEVQFRAMWSAVLGMVRHLLLFRFYFF